ncbi:MAG: sensory rhodopsin transducer [Ginsengibacter sp.]
MALGKKIWAIAEGYIPGYSNGPPPDFVSHEAACILNASDEDAHVQIMLYFTDKEPVGPYNITVPARRTKHLRFNNLTDPQPVPLETNYSSVFISDQPIVLQYTRLDSRQNANALITTIAYTE